MRCPNCGRMVPTNEWIAYRRHEDCAMSRYRGSATGSVSAAVRNGGAVIPAVKDYKHEK